jgi:tetratricopeptide (TPR) repeat protein
MLQQRNFNPWEGGEGKVAQQFLIYHREMALALIAKGDFVSAIKMLENCEVYPDNLGEGKIATIPENDIYYLKGLVHETIDHEKAMQYFRKATEGNIEPRPAMFYNDAPPDRLLYRALAWAKLGNKEKSISLLNELIDYGNAHLEEEVSIDYFAVSYPDMSVFDADLFTLNKIHCLYMIGLGYSGLGEDATGWFNKILELDVSHQEAILYKKRKKLLSITKD